MYSAGILTSNVGPFWGFSSFLLSSDASNTIFWTILRVLTCGGKAPSSQQPSSGQQVYPWTFFSPMHQCHLVCSTTEFSSLHSACAVKNKGHGKSFDSSLLLLAVFLKEIKLQRKKQCYISRKQKILNERKLNAYATNQVFVHVEVILSMRNSHETLVDTRRSLGNSSLQYSPSIERTLAIPDDIWEHFCLWNVFDPKNCNKIFFNRTFLTNCYGKPQNDTNHSNMWNIK